MQHLFLVVMFSVVTLISGQADELKFWEDPKHICSPNKTLAHKNLAMSKVQMHQTQASRLPAKEMQAGQKQASPYIDYNLHHASHQRLHQEFYSKLRQPQTGISCCSQRDCRPAQHRQTNQGHEFLINGEWVNVAQTKIIDNKLTPDGQSHWCGIDSQRFEHHTGRPITFCGIVAPGLF